MPRVERKCERKNNNKRVSISPLLSRSLNFVGEYLEFNSLIKL